MASTGVIAEPLDVGRLLGSVPDLVAGLDDPHPVLWESAVRAIGTTDTYPKGASMTVEDSDSQVVAQVAGFAKGSGMIAPDMATMLAFIFTDLTLDTPTAQECLKTSATKSFNRITVDSDTSTSDTVILFATGACDRKVDGSRVDGSVDGGSVDSSVDGGRSTRAAFQSALDAVSLDLAHQIVRDGEGATKFVAITVTGAENDKAAEIIARAVADSPLVKTALAASDANWGRIVAAVGKAGQLADRDRLAVWIGDEKCAEAGMAKPGYNEERATIHLQGSDVELKVDVGVGDGEATVWTCDLTHAYIDINASYRS